MDTLNRYFTQEQLNHIAYRQYGTLYNELTIAQKESLNK